MKNSNKFILLLVAILIGLLGCQKEYVPPQNDAFSDGVASKNRREEIPLPLGDTVSFVDLSQGVANRQWIIPDGTRFVALEGETVDPAGSIVHVEFNQPGDSVQVRLLVDLVNSEIDFDTTYTFTVLDTITGGIDVTNIESAFIEQTDDQLSIYEGGAITFTDISTGGANRRKWIFRGGSPEEAGGISQVEDEKVTEIKVQYPTIGVFDVVLISWREDPYGKPDTVVWENYVNVVKNEEPPVLTSVAESDVDSTIHLTYNLPMKITGDVTSNFSLMVDGNPVAIQSVKANIDNNQVIDILPEVDIFHTSEAILSYDGMGGLTRINDVEAPAFTDEKVKLTLPPNLLAAAGITYEFEEGGDPAGWDIYNFIPNNNASTNNSGLSMERTTDDAYEGNGSLVIHMNANEDLGDGEKNNASFSTDFANFPMAMESGKSYRLEFWFKVVGAGAAEFTCRVHAGGGWPPAPGGGWSPGAETDGWEFRTINWNAPIDADYDNIRLSIQAIGKDNNTATDIYIDNMLIYAVE